MAFSLNQLEEEIASFDQRQRHVALMAVGCPQRIRGLAGSGKTVILAMKAALAHLDDPTKYILVTFYTRSLRDHFKRLITRFYRHFGEGDRFSEPVFQIEGKCTLTTVYRAKGNEAAVVFALGCEAVPLATRSGRNRLFTAFTRTKGWLRITGMGRPFDRLKKEIETALAFTPKMKFEMPDPTQIELIQRDLSEKDARIQRVNAELERLREQFGISEDDLQTIVAERPRNGKR